MLSEAGHCVRKQQLSMETEKSSSIVLRKVACVLSQKKSATFLTPSLVEACKVAGIELCLVDPKTDVGSFKRDCLIDADSLSHNNEGVRICAGNQPYAAILHKDYSMSWEECLGHFIVRWPDVPILDPLPAVTRVRDRATMLTGIFPRVPGNSSQPDGSQFSFELASGEHAALSPDLANITDNGVDDCSHINNIWRPFDGIAVRAPRQQTVTHHQLRELVGLTGSADALGSDSPSADDRRQHESSQRVPVDNPDDFKNDAQCCSSSKAECDSINSNRPQDTTERDNGNAVASAVYNHETGPRGAAFELLHRKLRAWGLKFPLLAKPRAADGTAASHAMAVIRCEHGLRR